MKKRVIVFLCILLWAWGGNITAQSPTLDDAITSAITTHNTQASIPFYYQEAGRTLDEEQGGIVYLQLLDPDTQEIIPGIVDSLVVYRENGQWLTRLPGQANYTAYYQQLPPSVLSRINTNPYKPAPNPALVSPASRSRYQLPWEDEQWATVTRSFGRHGRGQIDFDISRTAISAAKDGMILYANDSHHLNAHSSGAWWYWNVVIIQHAPHEFSLYGHLAPNSIPDWIKAQCTRDYSQPNCEVPIQAGEIIAHEGNTGYSTAPHLHAEFGQQFGIVAYPDVLDENVNGDRSEWVYTGHIYAEHNIGFSGYSPNEVMDLPYGELLQAAHKPPLPTRNSLENSDFSNGTDSWYPTGQLNWSVVDGVMRFLRLNTQEPPAWALFLQDLPYSAPANAVLELQAELGNDSNITKTITLTLLNRSGRQYGALTCQFTIAPNTPLQVHTLRGIVDKPWATVRLEVSVNPPDGAPAALIDNINLRRMEDMPDSLTETACITP
jgi:murein DD-endopeptidase MepM/ murein hydrolase activator NlpD